MLSQHFTLDEMVFSEYAIRHQLDNTPDARVKRNLKRMCVECLEPIRVHFDAPLVVSSGYRSPQVNRDIGSNEKSAHPDGRATDFTVPSVPLLKVYEWIAGSDLPFDQLIWEYDRWIHLGIARDGQDPRRQLLRKMHGRPYEPFVIGMK